MKMISRTIPGKNLEKSHAKPKKKGMLRIWDKGHTTTLLVTSCFKQRVTEQKGGPFGGCVFFLQILLMERKQ